MLYPRSLAPNGLEREKGEMARLFPWRHLLLGQSDLFGRARFAPPMFTQRFGRSIGIGRGRCFDSDSSNRMTRALGSVRWPAGPVSERYSAGGGGGISGTRTPAIGIGGTGPRTGGVTARS